MKHLVQKIYKFFYDNPSLEKHKTLSDFLDTLPGFRIEEDNGISRIDMNLANYVSSICKQMANDMLLIPVKTNPTFCLPHVYYPIGESNIGDYAAFLEELEYGSYDFKYQGFVYTRNWFEKSIIPIVGKKENVAKNLKNAMEDISANFPDGITYEIPFDATTYIRQSIKEVYKTLFEALILVILVVFLSLQSWRAL